MPTPGAAAVAAHGLQATLPARWEARLYLRDSPGDTSPDPDAVRFAAHPAAYGHAGESMNPVLHLANFALPPGRGDYGSGAVERMGPAHAFVSLVEFDAAEAGRPLFAARGLPRPDVADFAPNQLQRRLAGQLGLQRFFTEAGRAFCLFAVLGSRRHAGELVGEIHDVLDGVRIDVRHPVTTEGSRA